MSTGYMAGKLNYSGYKTLIDQGKLSTVLCHPKQVLYQAEPRAEYNIFNKNNNNLSSFFHRDSYLPRPLVSFNIIHNESMNVREYRVKGGNVSLSFLLPNFSEVFPKDEALCFSKNVELVNSQIWSNLINLCGDPYALGWEQTVVSVTDRCPTKTLGRIGPITCNLPALLVL